jgi:hypothetical protein
MKYSIITFLLSFTVFLASCESDAFMPRDRGNVEIDFRPVRSLSIDSSRYWYLYPNEPSEKTPFLERGDLIGGDENGRIIVKLNNLNVGNYVFRYFINEEIKDHYIQVSGKTTKKYFLK